MILLLLHPNPLTRISKRPRGQNVTAGKALQKNSSKRPTNEMEGIIMDRSEQFSLSSGLSVKLPGQAEYRFGTSS
ncbi:MAG: hypothetical protein CMJ82_07965 [Planctomycetaceae bacterium]|nr:hypothetical protein [Planctomycetaceae bacterium]